MEILNDNIMNKLKSIKQHFHFEPVNEDLVYESGCGCTGSCGQSCRGGCETGCSGDCGRSCYGSAS